MSSTGASGVVRLRVLCGPTAAGKSALALRLSEAIGGAVLSADSRQIYRGFDIGTAKPTESERRRVPHYGIDLVAAGERYSAADWAARVPEWIGLSRAAGRTPNIVGGTGFYLRALFDPLFAAPHVDAVRRAALGTFLDGMDIAELRRWCGVLDPARAALGRVQLIRAVETAVLSGERISDLHVSLARAPSYTARYLLIDPGTGLDREITARTDRMLAAGWLEEVQSLAETVPSDAPAWTATGYDVLRTVTRGECSLHEARDMIVMRTRQYAKRQRTWFRHQLPAGVTTTLDPRAGDALDRAIAWWREDA
jgi:tRNA dimethylallyltransferase